MLNSGFVLEGKYKIISVLGRGGMSTVYLAVHQRLNQKWAIKEISREYCENYEMISRQLIAEADILKRLNHPGLPKIIDIIEKRNVIWMVMEFIEGKTLKAVLQQKERMEEKRVLECGKQLCDVLSYLHSQKPPIIYRDLKPENIILQKTGRLVLIDFGTAREYCYKENVRDEIYLGTRGYAAPEQYGSMGQTDERTDIYCLGVTLYSLLTGYNPEEPPYKIYPEKYWGENLSSGIKEIILTCIQPEPENRYQNCQELSYAFSHIEYTNQRKKENERKRIKVIFCCVLLILSLLAGRMGYGKISRFYKKKEVDGYIQAAEKSIDKREAEQYYKQALSLLPDEKIIYESLINYFILPNNFQTEEATILTSLVTTFYEEKTVLDIFREKNQKAYLEFCYAMGIGYFYDMGGTLGKGASEKWFQEIISIPKSKSGEEQLTKDKRKRASLYANIGDYYNTFLIYGRDESGERASKDFFDFYRTLHNLNQFEISEKSSESDNSAIYLISKEVAVEITNYAQEFLSDTRINKEMLNSELEKIRNRKNCFAKKKGEELSQFLEDAEEKIKTIKIDNKEMSIERKG